MREAPVAGPTDERRAAVIGGAVFLVSGASLVVHILTGAPLWALLAALVTGGCVLVARFVWALPAARAEWVTRVKVGAAVGLVATGAYDLSRWLLVQLGGLHLSPFKALPFFGEALLGGLGDGTVRTAVGIGFHLLNGVTFGIAYTAWFGRRGPWWGVPFALGLEAFMLALYPGWLDVRSVQELTEVSLAGHVVYGLTLGFGTHRALARRPAVGAPS
jgi:hypothetical protein